MKQSNITYYVTAILLSISLQLTAYSLWEQLSKYEAPTQKKFVFIICSCNNSAWYEANLVSAFCQDYPRDLFRIIYVDESRDGTANLVRDYVTQHEQWDHFTLLHNDVWQSIMPNHYKAAYLCDDEEIIVHLDGDDFLAHDKVLYLLNKVYNAWDIWLTYGQYQDWPVPAPGFSCDVPFHMVQANEFREMGFYYSHPRTFYAWLFKKIKLKDLIYKGSFIPSTPAVDYMFMFPMIEMAGQGHFKFIPDILYLYNRKNSLSTCNMPIKLEIPPARSWEKYLPLQEKDCTVTRKRLNKKADLIILSFNNPHELERSLIDGIASIDEIDAVTICYSAKSSENRKLYADLADRFNEFQFINRETDNAALDCNNEYSLVVTDTKNQIQNGVINNCIYELERTCASMFFLGLSKKSFRQCNEQINYGPFPDSHIEYRLAVLSNGIAAWQFEYETYAWDDPHIVDAVILRKTDLLDMLSSLQSDFSINNYIKNLFTVAKKDREIGLLFEESPLIKK